MTFDPSSLDPILLRQLRRAGLSDPAAPPKEDGWRALLQAVSDHYRRTEEDRKLGQRAADLSTKELEEMRLDVMRQRDSFRDTVLALSDTLGVFGNVVQKHAGANGDEVDTGIIEQAKRDFSTRLFGIFETNRDKNATADISNLSLNLLRLADRLMGLLTAAANQGSVRKELEIARAVQRMLVPTEETRDWARLEVRGATRPASECGGDYWFCFDGPDGSTTVLVGDVTGHGVASAIVTGVAAGVCESVVSMTGGRVTPSELLAVLDEVIARVGKRQVMMTFSASTLAPDGTLTMASAGHPGCIVVREGEARTVTAHGPPLGAAQGAAYEPQIVRIEPGDVLVWYTDGLVECEDPAGESFGEKRLRALCQRAAGGGVQNVHYLVESSLGAHTGGRPAADDMTLVVARVRV
jgi:hypothetical protein